MTTTTHEPSSPDTFVVSLPEGWAEVPMEPDELLAYVEAQAAASLSPEQRESIEFRRTLVLLRRLAEQSQQAGVVFLAVSSEQVPAEEGDEETSPFFLTTMASLVTRHAVEVGTARIAFEQLQAAVEQDPAEQGMRRVERPRVLDLPAGPAIRDVTVQTIRVPNMEEPVDVLHCRYHLLIGAGEGMAVLAFVSPNVEVADELLELFHAVAGTLEFVAA